MLLMYKWTIMLDYDHILTFSDYTSTMKEYFLTLGLKLMFDLDGICIFDRWASLRFEVLSLIVTFV